MLIESQKLLSDQEQPIDDGEDKKDPVAMEVDDTEPKDNTKAASDDVEMINAEEKPPEEFSKKDDSSERPIDIDPKTYCKLGHFHLLLEDYAKGKQREISY